MMITRDMQVNDAKKISELRAAAPFFQGRRDGERKDEDGRTFEELNKLFSTWNPDSMIYGLNRLKEIGATKKQYVYPVYSEDEINNDPSRKEVNLIHFPGKSNKPFVLVIAGGGWRTVCSMVEAFPVAAHLNELGYNAFVLNYRTYAKGERLFPKPLDDIAASIRYIFKNSIELETQNDHYAVCGFSAGACITDMWGLKTCGYDYYGLEKPDVLFSIYGAVSLQALPKESQIYTFENVFGEQYSYSDWDPYAVDLNMDASYPPCYVVACRDDEAVPVNQSEILINLLNKNNVQNRAEIVDFGGHGFGAGLGTQVQDWVVRAVEFWENLSLNKKG